MGRGGVGGKLHEGAYCREKGTALRCLGSAPRPSDCREWHTAEGEGVGFTQPDLCPRPSGQELLGGAFTGLGQTFVLSDP